MALSDPIPVRFSERTDDGLAIVSQASGLSKAELIRIAVDDFLRKTSETGEIVQRHIVQEVSGKFSHGVQTNNFSSAQGAPAPGPRKYPKGKRGKKGAKE